MSNITPQQLLGEFEDLLRTMPSVRSIGSDAQENLAWLGRAKNLVEMWRPHNILFGSYIDSALSNIGITSDGGSKKILITIHEAINNLRLATTGPLTSVIDRGNVYDYFEGIRKIVESAKVDLFFIDPYLDADFLERYLPHVTSDTTVRLLTNKHVDKLVPAIKLFRQQNNNMSIEVRADSNLHDRWVFVDRQSCYQSGASFKDGAKNSSTTLTQIVDVFDAMSLHYEEVWRCAVVQ